jgi:hypothetical protein
VFLNSAALAALEGPLVPVMALLDPQGFGGLGIESYGLTIALPLVYCCSKVLRAVGTVPS